jgi:putative acetyltransferase
MIEIRRANQDDLAAVRRLFEEYAKDLGINLAFQGFDEEVASLPGKYALPDGRLLIALYDNELAGCVAMRPLADGVCEMKRLYVRPSHRGRGIGKALVAWILHEAACAGYRAIRLDTLPAMTEAQTLYRAYGFAPIPPYYENPISGTVFMELLLTAK